MLFRSAEAGRADVLRHDPVHQHGSGSPDSCQPDGLIVRKDGLREDEQDSDEAQASEHGVLTQQLPCAEEGRTDRATGGGRWLIGGFTQQSRGDSGQHHHGAHEAEDLLKRGLSGLLQPLAEQQQGQSDSGARAKCTGGSLQATSLVGDDQFSKDRTGCHLVDAMHAEEDDVGGKKDAGEPGGQASLSQPDEIGRAHV